jgi:hypothetical protein
MRTTVLVIALTCAACGGRAGPFDVAETDAGAGRDGPAREAAGRDGPAPDAAVPADEAATGQPCDMDGGCDPGYTCWLQPPGGYCLAGPPTACRASGECPAGTLCSPLPASQISGVCLLACTGDPDCRPGYQCAVVSLFPGDPGAPQSPGPVCWVKPVCTPGADQTCNDNPAVSALLGVCMGDGTCACRPGAQRDPTTGKCR